MKTSDVVIIGGGPGGYEAALVAAASGAKVTLAENTGGGGAAVLTDCVPSKALITNADPSLARLHEGDGKAADLGEMNAGIRALASAQSRDIERGLEVAGVNFIRGHARLTSPSQITVTEPDGVANELPADVILVATGAAPRVMPSAQPDGERILTWQDIYTLAELPEHLIVVGSGVTGAELAGAYLGLGAKVTLVSSRDQVLPGEDQDAAAVIAQVFTERGMQVLSRSRMAGVTRVGDEVQVSLEDGRTITGSHALLAVGSVPNTADLGLAEVGVELSESGHIVVDRVSRTSVRGIYAAGDCTGVLPLASVAAMQGRIAMAHALGDAVVPLVVEGVSATVFTDPEIATVGISQADVEQGVPAEVVTLPLTTNPRAKMMGIEHGFVKLFAQPGSRVVLGGVIVAPKASELIYPVALAVANRLSVDQVAGTFTVYPSLSGSIAEAARRLH